MAPYLPPDRSLDLLGDTGKFARETSGEKGESGVRLREGGFLALPPYGGEVAFKMPEIGESGPSSVPVVPSGHSGQWW